MQQDFKVTDSYTAPKGTLIMPSITAATMQVTLVPMDVHNAPRQETNDLYTP